jgi:16S rRNA processing protein RimM
LPEPDGDEIYHADLIGLAAHDRAGQLVGRWSACSIWRRRTAGAESCRNVNGTRTVQSETVPDIDLDAGRLTIDPRKDCWKTDIVLLNVSGLPRGLNGPSGQAPG